ncbi:MAG: DUF3376 domain-containing protein [Ignavibacteriales bacterium]|nr:MAG: DUF3376 domain-containing protein [Ignavibacteriales bacterium]
MENYDKELRIGLVLYGGVSLCMYIFGVVYEFLRLVRREGAYKDLTDTARIKPVIDVISGTSAGGINGIFLAKALATGSSLDPLKSLWIDEGDLDKLLDLSRKPKSLLDSANYISKLEKALNQLNEGMNIEPVRSELIDLFITATDLDGVLRTFQDDYIKDPVTVKDYETVFHFKVRPERYKKALAVDEKILNEDRTGRNDFSGTNKMLKDKYFAKIAATTSAFPVAFAPVRFSIEEKKEMKELFQDQVCQGDLNKNTVYGDGGMVNNRPFNYTVQTIFKRQADTAVDRKLFYVEPDPESIKLANNKKLRIADDELVDGFNSLKGLFEAGMYQSISEDLNKVCERNKKILDVKKVITDLETDLLGYITTEKAELHRIMLRDPIYRTYNSFKLKTIMNRLTETLIRNVKPTEDKTEMKQFIESWVEEIAQDHASFLQDFDSQYRIRRIRYFIAKINKWFKEIQNLTQEQLEKLSILKIKLYNLIEYYEHSLWRITDKIGWITKTNVIETLNSYRNNYSQVMASSYREKAREVVKEIDSFLETNNLVSAAGQKILSADIFDRFEFLDMHIYPIQVLSDTGEADPIEIVRISPELATHYSNGDNSVENKLAGEKLMHFSAFLKKSWRENDIMQGRLDAAEIIVKSVLKDNTNDEYSNAIISRLCKDIVEVELTEIVKRSRNELFAGITSSEKKKITELLSKAENFKIVATEEYFIKNYKVGLEELRDLSKDYTLLLSSKALRTFGFMLERLPLKSSKLISGLIQRPIKFLSNVFNYLYYFVSALNGELKDIVRKGLVILIAFIVLLLLFNLFGWIRINNPYIWSTIALFLVYVIFDSKLIRIFSSIIYIAFIVLNIFGITDVEKLLSLF